MKLALYKALSSKGRSQFCVNMLVAGFDVWWTENTHNLRLVGYDRVYLENVGVIVWISGIQ